MSKVGLIVGFTALLSHKPARLLGSRWLDVGPGSQVVSQDLHGLFQVRKQTRLLRPCYQQEPSGSLLPADILRCRFFSSDPL